MLCQMRKSRSGGNIGEVQTAAVSILVVQRNHRIAACQKTGDQGIVHHRNIKPAIVVTIKERDTATPIVSRI